LVGAGSLFRVVLCCGLAGFSLVVAAHAQDAAAPRQIDPDRFAPMPRDAATIAAPHPVAPGRIASPPPVATVVEAPRAPILAPTRERPQGACDRTARDWLACLAATAQLSDSAVEDADARLVVGLDRRPRLNPVTRQAVGAALRGAQGAWRSLRERECADLTLIESGLTGTLYEVRLLCRIRRNLERVEALSAHYSEQP
jgi:uncharacterized protein YecT (DUF1311 family)